MSTVSLLRDTEYTVASSSGNGNYTVAVLKLSFCKPDNCLLRCLKCNICIHMYSYTCPDYSVAANMCKHIHLVGKIKRKENSVHPHQSYYIHRWLTLKVPWSLGGKTTDVIEAKRKALTSIQQLTAFIEECKDEDLIPQVTSEINKSIRILTSEIMLALFLECQERNQVTKKIHHREVFSVW